MEITYFTVLLKKQIECLGESKMSCADACEVCEKEFDTRHYSWMVCLYCHLHENHTKFPNEALRRCETQSELDADETDFATGIFCIGEKKLPEYLRNYKPDWSKNEV